MAAEMMMMAMILLQSFNRILGWFASVGDVQVFEHAPTLRADCRRQNATKRVFQS